MKRVSLAAAIVLVAGHAFAGEFYEKDGFALRGYDPVAYFTQGKPVKGSSKYTAQYQGSTFEFASQENRDAFAADPARYAPQYGGYCAYGTALKQKAATDPSVFTVVDGKLYLNYNRDVQKLWNADVPGYIVKGDANWPEVRQVTKVIE